MHTCRVVHFSLRHTSQWLIMTVLIRLLNNQAFMRKVFAIHVIPFRIHFQFITGGLLEFGIVWIQAKGRLLVLRHHHWISILT